MTPLFAKICTYLSIMVHFTPPALHRSTCFASCRAAASSASSPTQAASAGAAQLSLESKEMRTRASQGMPFADISNTPASRASEHASPTSMSHQGISGVTGIAQSPGSMSHQGSDSAKGIAKSPNGRKSLRRYSQGLENLQQQLQGVMTEGSQIQVGDVSWHD